MAGVDVLNQFPNSKMAAAVKAGASRMVSDDAPSKVLTPQLENVAVSSATLLSALGIPTGASYAVLTAVGGALYVTYDGSTPSATNYAIAVSQDNSLPVQGAAALAAIKIQGTSLSASFWS